MTTSDFRNNPVLVGALKALLIGDNGTPSVLAQAIVAVQNEKPAPNVPEGHPEIASVRRLSRITGYEESLELLLSCAEPLPPPVVEEPATFNVDPEKFKQLYPDK
jgi:hypothetical protein